MRKLFLALGFFVVAAIPAEAAQVDAVFLANCKRVVGIILKADKQSVFVLDVQGSIKEIPKHAVLGIAKYPLPNLPFTRVDSALAKEKIPKFYRFYTLKDGQYEEITTGWPIEFNQEHIQILSSRGNEFLVERNIIWQVDEVEPPSQMTFVMAQDQQSKTYLLRQPLSFEHCKDKTLVGAGATTQDLRPQDVYDHPIAIKRYLDHLQEGLAKIDDYHDSQRFYAVPQVYENKTLLGTWFLVNSRYTNVGARKINLLPYVQDEYSEGPFGFQRIVRSGVYPLDWSMHEEPLLQAYYALKADYISLEIFFDPAFMLIGSRYGWSKGNLNALDDRWVETGGFKFGIDISYFSLFFTITGGKTGVRVNSDFIAPSFSANNVGLKYQYKKYKFSVLGGDQFAEDPYTSKLETIEKSTYRFHGQLLRFNYQGPLMKNYELLISLIRRELKNSSRIENSFQYKSAVETISGQVNWHWDYRWTIYFLAALENQTIDVTYKSRIGRADDTNQGRYFKYANGVTVAF